MKIQLVCEVSSEFLRHLHQPLPFHGYFVVDVLIIGVIAGMAWKILCFGYM